MLGGGERLASMYLGPEPRNRLLHQVLPSFFSQVQFLDKVLDMPVVVLRQVRGSMVQKTGVVPQLQFIEGCRHCFRAADAVSHGPDYSADL